MRRALPPVLAAACLSCTPQPRPGLALESEMTASELNVELAKAGAWRPAELKEPDWLGLNGPLDLRLRINGRILDIPVSRHGGLQLVTTLGPEAACTEARLNMVVADVDPAPLTAGQARALAHRLCRQVSSAGLSIYDGPPARKAAAGRDGPGGGCWVRDGRQSIQVRVDDFGTSGAQHRVRLSFGPLWPKDGASGKSDIVPILPEVRGGRG